MTKFGSLVDNPGHTCMSRIVSTDISILYINLKKTFNNYYDVKVLKSIDKNSRISLIFYIYFFNASF